MYLVCLHESTVTVRSLIGRYMSGKLLLKLDSVNFILANHTVCIGLRACIMFFSQAVYNDSKI